MRRGQSGFTYLMLLWWVAISGVLLMALSTQWSMDLRRQKEAELLFRGEQIRRAIEAYGKVPVREGVSRLPRQLDDLLLDRRSGESLHHLRRAWPDPITGRAWGLIRDETTGGILGVYSTSAQVPMKQQSPADRYADWRFEAAPPVTLPASSADAVEQGGRQQNVMTPF